MKQLSEIDVSGKRVFVRADLDVPLESVREKHNGEREASQDLGLETATRLQNLKPTVDYLLEHDASRIIIAGHIDRPKKPDPTLSTKQLIEPISQVLGREIVFCPDLSTYSKPGLEQLYKPGLREIFLLENLRFWPGEEKKDREFARQLASTAEVYVNDAFGNCHRNHASMSALPQMMIHAAGLHLAREVEVLSKLLKEPDRPFVAVVGGAKIETKVPVISHLARIADNVLVGGELPIEIEASGTTFGLNVRVASLTPDQKDISDESAGRFLEIIKGAKTVVWNGPMGIFEEGFDKGSKAISEAIISSGAYSVVGGGEMTEFLGKLGLLGRFGFVSSGGGAMLEFLAGRTLPAIEVLD